MDSITDLPPMTTLPADHVADSSPPMTTNHAHPPYTEMIIATITALKDKDGSSKQAISKYIEKEFANLPPTHSVLLTHHLKRLKDLGQLVMVKYSYMLPPRSGQFDFTDEIVDTVGVNLGNSLSDLSKRKPGRPAKLKPRLGVPNQIPNVQPFDADVQSYQPQFPYHVDVVPDSDFQGNSAGGAEPLFASLGLGDDGVAVQSPTPTENATVLVKRGRGRPPKVGGGEIQGIEAVSGRLVRKPKMTSVTMGGNGVRVKRGRGRPRRIGIGAVTVPLSGNVLRPRGRPKRVGRPSVAVNGGVGEGVFGSRRPGRPSRNKIANLTGKRLGRPSKGGPGTAVLVTDPRQLVVYQELQSKYELLQSKVKQVANTVKLCLDPDYGHTALAALQELEALAGEVNAPSHGQTHEPAPFPQN